MTVIIIKRARVPAAGQQAATRTSAASAARIKRYENRAKEALPYIWEARASGAKNALQFAIHLNSVGCPAPTNAKWNADAALRCLAKLQSLRLDQGSLSASAARIPTLKAHSRRHNKSARVRAPLPKAATSNATPQEPAGSGIGNQLHRTSSGE